MRVNPSYSIHHIYKGYIYRTYIHIVVVAHITLPENTKAESLHTEKLSNFLAESVLFSRGFKFKIYG